MSDSKARDEAATTVVEHSETEEYLVVQRASHDSMPLSWEFPGGGIDEKDQSPREAALRELGEETGLDGEILDKGETSVVELEERLLKIHVFKVEVKSKEVDLSNEHCDFQWVSKTEVKKFSSEEGVRKDLEAIDEW